MLEVQRGRHEQVIILCQREGWRRAVSCYPLDVDCPPCGWFSRWHQWDMRPRERISYAKRCSSEDRSDRWGPDHGGPWEWKDGWCVLRRERMNWTWIERSFALKGHSNADRREQHYPDQCSNRVRRVIKPDQELTCLPERIWETPYKSQTSKVVTK